MNQDKAVSYARKSSEQDDRQVRSVADQEVETKRLETIHKIPIVEGGFLHESKSAKEPDKREEFKRMVQMIERGLVNTIYVAVVNRLARNAKEAGVLIELLDSGKLKQIISPSAVYNKNVNSEMLWIEFMGSSKFSKDLSKVVTERLKLKAERGDLPNRAPLGYKNTPLRLKGTRVIIQDNARWDLMRKWWEMMVSGAYTVESSLERITELGLTGKKGKNVSRTVAFKIFRNIFYTGNFKYSGTVYPGNHKGMVTMTEFLKVQKLLDSKGSKGAFTRPEVIPYLGLFKCPCGAAITAEKHTKRYKNGNSQVFTYYRCSKKKGECNQKYLNAKQLEPQVINFIASLELNPLFTEFFKKVLKRRNTEEFNFSIKQKELNTKRLIAIDEEKKLLYGMKIEGMISQEEFEIKKNDLLKREQALKEEQNINHTEYWEKVLDNTLNFASNVTKLFENGDPYIRQQVIRIIGSNLTIENQKIKIEAKNAFMFLRSAQDEILPQNLWLEPEEVAKLRTNRSFVNSKFASVPRAGLCSNLSTYFNNTSKESSLLVSQLSELNSYIESNNFIYA